MKEKQKTIKNLEQLNDWLMERNDIFFHFELDPKTSAAISMTTSQQYNCMAYEIKPYIPEGVDGTEAEPDKWSVYVYESWDLIASILDCDHEAVENVLRCYGVRQKIRQERLL